MDALLPLLCARLLHFMTRKDYIQRYGQDYSEAYLLCLRHALLAGWTFSLQLLCSVYSSTYSSQTLAFIQFCVRGSAVLACVLHT